MSTIYPASSPPSGNTTPQEAWTAENVPIVDGTEQDLGKDAFLTLLLTQLQNQDPTNPLDNTEMTAQLAQFSQLEQLANMNSSIELMTSFVQAQNQFQTLTMIGKEVLAENDQLSVTDGKSDFNASVITTESCNLVAYVVNASGEQVRMIDLGNVDAGEHEIKWDGKNNSGDTVADGAYRFQVTATNVKGEVLDSGVYPQVAGKITAVSFDSTGQPVVHMGNASLALSQVIQILEEGTLGLDTAGSADGDSGDSEDSEG